MYRPPVVVLSELHEETLRPWLVNEAQVVERRVDVEAPGRRVVAEHVVAPPHRLGSVRARPGPRRRDAHLSVATRVAARWLDARQRGGRRCGTERQTADACDSRCRHEQRRAVPFEGAAASSGSFPPDQIRLDDACLVLPIVVDGCIIRPCRHAVCRPASTWSVRVETLRARCAACSRNELVTRLGGRTARPIGSRRCGTTSRPPPNRPPGRTRPTSPPQSTRSYARPRHPHRQGTIGAR